VDCPAASARLSFTPAKTVSPSQDGSASPAGARLDPQASLDTSFRLTWARQYHDSSIRR